MDPVSLSLTIVGLLPVIARVIHGLKSFYSDAIHAKSLIQQLLQELEALSGNLKSLQDLLESPALKAKSVRFDESSVLVSCSTACKTKLESLCETMELYARSRTRQLMWPLAQTKFNESLQTLRNFAFWIQLGLSVEGCHLLSRNSAEVTKTLTQHCHQLKSIQEDIQSLQTTVDTQLMLMGDSRQEQMRREVLDWVSCFDHDKRHLEAKNPRVDNTGNWITHDPSFERWLHDSPSANVVWCHGLPGSGKTILASVVIDHLMFSPSEVSVSHFYIKYTDQGTQILSTILASILRQALSRLAEIPDSVMEIFQSHRRAGRAIGTAEAMRELLDVSTAQRTLCIVIDALDESNQNQHRKVLHAIKEVAECKSIKLLLTSRSHIADIESSLAEYPQILIQAHDLDLECYMNHLIRERDQYDIVDESFANHITRQMAAKANGTFLPVVLQLETVLRKTTRGHMEDALGSISDDLAIVFEETMSRIDHLPEDHRLLAKRVLAWLVHAKASLTSEELGDGLSVSDSITMGLTSWSTRYRPLSKAMISCCQGLAILKPVTKCLSLAHYTVQEYFEKHADRLFPGAQEDISTTCLSYLLYKDFQSGPCHSHPELRRRVTQYPFVRYAALHWGKHVADTEKNPAVARLLSKFLRQRTSTAAACQLMGYIQGYRDEYWAHDESMSVTPLHIASRCGLKATLQRLLRTDCINEINLSTAQVKSTPVILAASGADTETLSILLCSGADPFISNWYGDALHCACEAGESQNVRLLLRFGMIPNAYPATQRLPIMCTVDYDRLDTFRTLVELAGGPVSPRTNSVSVSDPDLLQHLFFHAVDFGAYRIVNWLLGNKQEHHRVEWLMRSDYHYLPEMNYQFDLDSPTMGGPALHLAILNGDVEMVRLLVAWGADTHVTDEAGETALTHAAKSGISALVDILGSDLRNLQLT